MAGIGETGFFKRAFRKLLHLSGFMKYYRKFDNYLLKGYVIFEDGTRKNFVIDNADSPHLFDVESLEQSDVYFKMQYPIDIDDEAFELTPNVHLKWCEHRFSDSRNIGIEGLYNTIVSERPLIENFHRYISKIKPLMNGPRYLSLEGNSYAKLKAAYDNYISALTLKKDMKIMCYFGNDTFGMAIPDEAPILDSNYENVLMRYYYGLIEHPNCKRAEGARRILLADPSADVRIIHTKKPDGKIEFHPEQIVPLKDFCRHISRFQYNFNVAGYRMSIPSRFIESFIVGTAIITDKLAVKWYLPFDECEVVETVKMGYLPNNKVNWEQFEQDIKNLPNTDPEKIIECFNRKWQPSAVARYMIDTLRHKEKE